MSDIELSTDVAAWAEVYRKAAHERAQAQEVMDLAKERLTDALGDAETGTLHGRPVVRWAWVESRRLDQKLAKIAVPADVLEQCYTVTRTRRFTLPDGDDD